MEILFKSKKLLFSLTFDHVIRDDANVERHSNLAFWPSFRVKSFGISENLITKSFRSQLRVKLVNIFLIK